MYLLELSRTGPHQAMPRPLHDTDANASKLPQHAFWIDGILTCTVQGQNLPECIVLDCYLFIYVYICIFIYFLLFTVP